MKIHKKQGGKLSLGNIKDKTCDKKIVTTPRGGEKDCVC